MIGVAMHHKVLAMWVWASIFKLILRARHDRIGIASCIRLDPQEQMMVVDVKLQASFNHSMHHELLPMHFWSNESIIFFQCMESVH